MFAGELDAACVVVGNIAVVGGSASVVVFAEELVVACVVVDIPVVVCGASVVALGLVVVVQSNNGRGTHRSSAGWYTSSAGQDRTVIVAPHRINFLQVAG